jgi:DNA invertase Pin-like site-specific DNA recombinase
MLAYVRNGDTLAVVRLDRLGRSLAELLATVTMLKERGIALLSLETLSPLLVCKRPVSLV